MKLVDASGVVKALTYVELVETCESLCERLIEQSCVSIIIKNINADE